MSSARQRLTIYLFADFTYTAGELITYYFPDLLQPPSPPQHILTINVPLFKKLRDIILFWWDNHFMSHFEGHFEGAKTFLTP